MRVAIVGYGLEGQSALVYWENLGAEVTICDQNASLQVPMASATQLGESYLHDLDRFDVIVRSAGVRPQIILAENPGVEHKITSVINEFLRVCPTKNVIGITGTKGKGTTSTLVAQMLEGAGKDVVLAGNIGLSPLDFLPQLTPDSWVVLELSSFQLIDLKHSPHIAACLMVVPEHLNWHADIEDYTQAKSQLFVHQNSTDIAIYFADSTTSHQIASASPGAKIAYFAQPGAYIENNTIMIDNQEICHVDELKLLGRHHWENACAAATIVWQVVQAPAAIRNVLTSFSGLPHRIEFVRELDDVRYYDDSFGTTPETAIVAMEAFEQPKVMILGGGSKGVSFDDLAKAVAEDNVRAVVVVGTTAAEIMQALIDHNFTAIVSGGKTMTSIVEVARKVAQKGDVILLSPACSSFGLFTDYKDRGNQFKEVVNALR